jgi:hypothetical protein
MDNCHHPAFIAVDLLCSVADREGSPQFKAACYLIRDGYNAMGKDAGEAMLRVVRTFDA